jgi:uncharacterized Fe-S cluster protein YjdI
MAGVRRQYTNGEITVVWEPGKCLHSSTCFRGLPQVFDPRKRPWVMIMGAPSEAIVTQVGRCPSGALTMGPAPSAATEEAGFAPEPIARKPGVD